MKYCPPRKRPSSGCLQKFSLLCGQKTGWIWIVIFALGAGSCTSNKWPDRSLPDPNAALAPRKDQPIGTVVHTDKEFGFVLVDVGMFTGFEPGSQLECRREGERVALLNIAQQAMRPFLAADVVEGKPQIGDLVYKNF